VREADVDIREAHVLDLSLGAELDTRASSSSSP
jgi:hypothetical protein